MRAAAELEIAQATFSSWETGRRDPPGMLLYAMRALEKGVVLPRAPRALDQTGSGGSIGMNGELVTEDEGSGPREMDGLDRAQADAFEAKQSEWDRLHALKNREAADELERGIEGREVGPVGSRVVEPSRNVETFRGPVPKPVARGGGADPKPSGEEAQTTPSYEDASQDTGVDEVNQEYRKGGRGRRQPGRKRSG